jgi:hypothetical protein
MFKISNSLESYTHLTAYQVESYEKLFSICIDGVFTEFECADLIRLTENQGYTKATLFDENNVEYDVPDYRKGLRCIVDDEQFARILEERILHLIPKMYMSNKYHSINPRFRCLKYDEPSHHFEPHCDGCYSTENHMSMITILIYLNENYEGAKTSLHSDEETIINQIIPKTGMVYLMDQEIFHSVPNLISGTKYAIRTELMYWI